jgi:AmiR/NasT family two-component response regulator
MAVRLILVEPEEDQRDQFLNAVRGSAFEVCHISETNTEAVEAVNEVHPQLIVFRATSGKLGATQALDKLQRTRAGIKAVVSYDVRTTHLLMAAYSAGAVAAIKRPFGRHRVVEKLTFAIASERHERLGGPIVRLEHPVEVRYRGNSFFSFSKVGFCERLGLTDMDLNVVKPLKERSTLRLEIRLPEPHENLKYTGSVEAIEMTRPEMWCAYISLPNLTAADRKADRKAIEAFLVKAAKRA